MKDENNPKGSIPLLHRGQVLNAFGAKSGYLKTQAHDEHESLRTYKKAALPQCVS